VLVLSRKMQESILIGEDVSSTVLEISGNRVRLGITAPAGVRIMRHELLMGLTAEVISKADSAA
jgi:carbon storage regulator